MKKIANIATMVWMAGNAIGATEPSLTPYQRFEAVRNLHQVYSWHSILTNRWFVMLGWSLIAILALLLALVRRQRVVSEKQTVLAEFDRLAETAELDERQKEILLSIAKRSEKTNLCEVFWNIDAFEKGQSQLMKDLFQEGKQLAYRRSLQEAIYQIADKLGFAKPSAGSQSHLFAVPSSRQIPTGAVVKLSLDKNTESDITALVSGNDNYELTLLPSDNLNFQPGQLLSVLYPTGSAVWAYDMLVLAWSEGRLSLHHTERGKLVNRRRYARVSVKTQGFAANWPLFESLNSTVEQTLPEIFNIQMDQIAGPSVRFYADTLLAVGQRILIAFALPSRQWVRDMAYIRQIRPSSEGTAYIAELIGLNQRHIDELVGICHHLASVPTAVSTAAQPKNIYEVAAQERV